MKNQCLNLKNYQHERSKKWDRIVKINAADPYSKCCVDVARRTMELIDKDPGPLDNEKVFNLISTADKDVKAGGITMMMASCVASIITDVHERGEEFRVAWNREEKSEGVINKAIFQIKK